jgi:transcription elongation GreA/GreB family factor
MLRCMPQPVKDQLGGGALWPSVAGVEPQTPQVPATITREGERQLQARAQRLRHQLDVEFAARLNEARGFGEIGGNDDYLQTLEERAVLASRLARLQRLLDAATVVDRESAKSETVAVGSVVEVEDLAARDVHEHRLVGDYEALDGDGVSASSPVGRALIGQPPGVVVEVELPHGRARTLRILNVRAAAGSSDRRSRRKTI